MFLFIVALCLTTTDSTLSEIPSFRNADSTLTLANELFLLLRADVHGKCSQVGVYSLATGTMVHEFTLTKCQSTNGIQSMKAVPTQEGTSAGLLVFGIRGTAEVHIMRVNQMHAMTVTMLNVVPEVRSDVGNLVQSS